MNSFKYMFKTIILIAAICLLNIHMAANPPHPTRNSSPKLTHILKKTSQYCQKLKQSAFHFVCHQEVKENFIHKLHGKKNTGNSLDQLTHYGKVGIQQFIEQRGKNKYLYDYRILQKNGSIQENRQLLKHNGKKIPDQKKIPKTTIYSYKNALAPIDYFLKKNQHYYNYRLKDSKKLLKRYTYEIEVSNRSKIGESRILAVFWINAIDFSIIKYQSYVGRFSIEDLAGSADHNINNIKFTNIHYFGIKKKGIRFPSKTKITLTFNGGPMKIDNKPVILPYGTQRYTKIKTQFKYSKYMFHQVSVKTSSFIEIE